MTLRKFWKKKKKKNEISLELTDCELGFKGNERMQKGTENF